MDNVGMLEEKTQRPISQVKRLASVQSTFRNVFQADITHKARAQEVKQKSDKPYLVHLKSAASVKLNNSTQLRLPAGKLSNKESIKNLSMYFTKSDQTLNSFLIS